MLQAISLLFLLFYTQFPIRFSWRYCLRSSGRLNQPSEPDLCRAFYLRCADLKTERLLNSLSLRPFSCTSSSPTAVYRHVWFCQLRYVVFYIRINLFLDAGRIGGSYTKRSRATAQAVGGRALTTKFMVLGQSMWKMWWIKWQYNRFFPPTFLCFPL